MAVNKYFLSGGRWTPQGGGATIAPGPGFTPSNLAFQVDLRLRPPAANVVFGCSPTVGTREQIEAVWGRKIQLQRVYATTIPDLAALMAKCQSLLNIGVTPVLDFNSPASYAGAGFPMTNVAGTGKTMWQAQADGYFDVGKSAAESFTGQAYPGFDEFLLGVKNLDAGTCPSNRIFLSKDHEMESPTEGGGNGKVVGAVNAVVAGTQPEFRAAWRHFRARATALGVVNALFVFNFASATTRWGTAMTDTGSDGFYPGHDAVDVVAWDPYNSAGIRDSTWRSFSNMLNKFGQLDWWKANFAVDGGDTLASSPNGRVYKPAMLAEFGTTDSLTTAAGTLYTAETWATDMAAWLAIPANKAILRWVLYFNNVNNTILNDPSYRRTGFTNVGKGSLWG